MSNKLPQYTQVRDCTLPPWDNYKLKKFADKSTNARISSIKSCVNGNSTASGTYKGGGMGSSGGFRPVQGSGARTNKLGSIVNSFTKSEQEKFAAEKEAAAKKKIKDAKKKLIEKKIAAKKLIASKKRAAVMLAAKKQNKQQ